MNKVTWGKRLRYRFDNYMSRGTAALIGGLAQVSENKYLNAVFADIFDPEGSEIYVRPAGGYVQPGVPVSFYTLVEAARRRGQVAFGYRLKAHAGDAAHSYGVVVNPLKSAPVTLGAGAQIIVLAEE